MRRLLTAVTIVMLALALPLKEAAGEYDQLLSEVRGLAGSSSPAAALHRLREEIDKATSGKSDVDLRPLLAEAVRQAHAAGDFAAAATIGTRSLAAARAAGASEEVASALGDLAKALDGLDRTEEATALWDEAKSLMEAKAGDIPVMQRIALYLDMAKRMRGLGDNPGSTRFALEAADLLLPLDLPPEQAVGWVRKLVELRQAAVAAGDPEAVKIRISALRFAARTRTGEPGSSFSAGLDDAVAVCAENPELARDLLLDVFSGPLFGPWLAGNRVKFIDALDMAGAKWGLAGSMASTGEEGRTIRRPLLDVLEAGVALLAAPDASLPPEAEALLRRALYTGLITHEYARGEAAGLRALTLLKARPEIDFNALAGTYSELGEIYTETERYDEARSLLKEGLTVAREHGARAPLVATLAAFAALERKVGTPASTALAYGDLLAEIDSDGLEAERGGDPLAAAAVHAEAIEAAHAWVARSIAMEELGRSDEAEFGYRRSLEISRRIGDRSTFAFNAVYLIHHYRHFGRLDEALALADLVIADSGKDAAPPPILSVKAHALVSRARALESPRERAEQLDEAASLVAAANERRGEADELVKMEREDDLRLLAEIARLSGRTAEAREIVSSLIDAERGQSPQRPARLVLLLIDRAVLDVEAGDPAAALTDLAEAQALSPETAGDVLSLGARASVLRIQAETLGRLGRRSDAHALAGDAARLGRSVARAAEGGLGRGAEDTRQITARIFETAVRAGWNARP